MEGGSMEGAGGCYCMARRPPRRAHKMAPVQVKGLFMSEPSVPAPAWQQAVFQALKAGGIRQIAYVPDAGHAHAIRAAQADGEIADVVLTTEEEGVALAAGAYLGGQRAALLMQSSGVGNCVNMLSLIKTCAFPFLTLITMRGEWGEFNPWQVPMGQSTPAVLAASGVLVERVSAPQEVRVTMEAAVQ